MRYTLSIGGSDHLLELNDGNPRHCRFDGSPFEAEAVEVTPGEYSLLIGGRNFLVRVGAQGGQSPSGSASESLAVQVDGASYSITVQDPRRWSGGRGAAAREGRQQITAPMPGKVVRVLVQEGDPVASGQGLIVVEAMKMQNEIKSRAAGTVQKVLAREGQAVASGESLILIE